MRNQRSLWTLAVAVLCGVAAVIAVQRYLAARTPDAVETVTVVTASRSLTAGSAIAAGDLVVVDWPKERVPAGVRTGSDGLEGRVLRRAIADGEPIFEAALLPEGAAAGLLGVISPDHRAVSVKVDAVIGIAGFVKPGARVDVLATLRKGNGDPFSKVILQDVRVLAIDDTLEEANGGDPQVVNVVTVEVEPKQAEHLILAAHEGRLQLALRKQGDGEIVSTRAVRAGDLMDQRNPKAPGRRIQLIRGTDVDSATL